MSDLILADPLMNASSLNQSEPSPVVIGEYAYFKAFDSNYGAELWRTDGTTSGTNLLIDINPGHLSSNPRLLTKSGDTLFFVAQRYEETYLWQRTTDYITPILHLTTSISLIDVDGKLFFEYEDDLWVVDGLGMRKIKESAFVASMAAFNGYLLYQNEQGVVWFSDGTSAGTQSLNNYPTNPMPVRQALVADTTFFVGDSCELWRTQNLTNGLELIKDFSMNDSCNNGTLTHLTVMDGMLFSFGPNTMRFRDVIQHIFGGAMAQRRERCV